MDGEGAVVSRCLYSGFFGVFFASNFLSALVFSVVSTSQHGHYSRTVVLRLLERKYKSLVSDSMGDRYIPPRIGDLKAKK